MQSYEFISIRPRNSSGSFFRKGRRRVKKSHVRNFSGRPSHDAAEPPREKCINIHFHGEAPKSSFHCAQHPFRCKWCKQCKRCNIIQVDSCVIRKVTAFQRNDL